MKDLILYNSLSRQKEVFVPRALDGVIRMYVCGPTVYDFAHLGNARAMVVFDVLFRLLQKKYKAVEYVRNITDIDDKIYNASCLRNCTIGEITKQFEAEFLDDMDALAVFPPTHSPHATVFIPEMVTLIQTLLTQGVAYIAEKHVLFSVEQFPSYGKLSRKSRSELLAGARIEVAPYKRNAADFVLWKPSSPEQPGWESPWGRGRPGWHIECSAMSAHYFKGKGDAAGAFDIHAGGIDLIFPHHENERAQSCCALNIPEMARFWLHNGHLMVDGKKMSKSLGNFLTVRQLRARHNPEALRLALLTAHYRQPLDWTENVLKLAEQWLDRWYRILDHVPESVRCEARKASEEESILDEGIESALCEDMNTPLALQVLNRHFQAYVKEPSSCLLRTIFAAGRVLGLLYQEPKAWFQKAPLGEKGEKLDEAMIEAALKERLKAKSERDFVRADRIRQTLFEQGVILEDSSTGTKWRRSR